MAAPLVGLPLALAISLKTYPVLFLLLLLIRRRYAAVAWTVALIDRCDDSATCGDSDHPVDRSFAIALLWSLEVHAEPPSVSTLLNACDAAAEYSSLARANAALPPGAFRARNSA